MKKYFIHVFPVDSWDCWCYEILMEDIMSPFFVAYSSINEELEFISYADAYAHGQEKVNELLKDLDKSE